MEIEHPADKKPSDDESSSEENEVGQVTQKIDLKLDLIESNSVSIKKKDNLWLANRVYFCLWGNASVFVQSIVNEMLVQNKVAHVGFLNFNKAKQKALSNIYCSLSTGTFYIIFNEPIKEYTEYNFPEFLSKTFGFEPNSEFVILDNISKQMLKKGGENHTNLRFISTNHHSKDSFEALKHLAIPLEIGNSIESLGADIIVFCELKKIKANLFLGVNEEFEVNMADIKKFDTLLPHYTELKEKVEDKNITELIKKARKIVSMNLYN